jgi:histidine triad (HIT) family protein
VEYASDCVFCAIARGEVAARIVHQDEQVVAFLDRAPLIAGHTLVAPRRHVETLDDLPSDLVAPLFETVRRVSVALQRGLAMDGSFVAVNTRVSQSVPHLHAHVVPRRQKDGFFSPRVMWRRHRYESDDEALEIAAKIRAALSEGPG